MATWTAGTALGTGALISQAWIQNVVNAQKFLAATDTTYGKDLCQMRRTTTQSLTAGSYNAISFNAEDFDVAGGHDTGTNTYRYTAKAAGKYRLTGAATVTWTTAASPSLQGRFTLNGTAITGSLVYVCPGSTTAVTVVMPAVYVSLAVNDWVSFEVFWPLTGGGTGQVVDPTAGAVQMGVEWVGAT